MEPRDRDATPMTIETPIPELTGVLPKSSPHGSEDDAEAGASTTEDPSHPLESGPLFDRSKPVSRWVLAVLGGGFLAVCFAQAPGLIVYDTKMPMLLSPLRYLETSLHAWNQGIYAGTVIFDTGYVVPMGLFFALTHVLHIPVWCAQRIWLALLLTIACWGVVRLSEALGIGTRGSRVIAGLAFCAAPIVITRITDSAALLAIVFLPWMLQPLVVGSRRGSPRQAAARSGVAVALMGGSNAAVVLAVLPLGVIWLLTRKRGPRRRSLTLWWLIAVGLACFWWVVATALVGRYGFNYLPYTETSVLTTSTASAFEALRGASYWYDYYNLHGPLIPGDWIIVSWPAVIVASSVLAALGLAGLCRRIPERLFLVSSLSFGVLAIAAGYAGADGGFFSNSVQHLLQGSLAPFRNIGKFSQDVTLPLVLGLAWILSLPRWSAVLHLSPRRLRGRVGFILAISVLAIAVLFVSAAPYWRPALYKTGGFAAIPSYWVKAGAWLDAHQGHANTLLLPDSSFADYTWGSPVDEPLQIVSDTPVEFRSIIPLSSNGNIQALNEIENVIDSGTTQPGLSQFLTGQGIKYVVERNDLNLAATGAPPPAQVHEVLSETAGLTEVASFGPYLPRSQTDYGQLPVYDSPTYSRLRPVEIFRVNAPSSLVKTYPASDPVVMSGDAGSLLALSGAGVSNGRASVLSGDPLATSASSSSEATWAITDGNRRVVVAFGGVRDNDSYILSAHQTLPGQAYGVPMAFTVVPGVSHQTVSAPIGAASVSASSYGSSPLIDDPNEGPAAAFDGNPKTAWVANANDNSTGQWVSITFNHELSPQQPTVSRVVISTDQGSVSRYLPDRGSPVQLAVPRGPSLHLKITIAAVRPVPPLPNGGIVLGAGISNVAIPGLVVRPQMEVPDDPPSHSTAANAPAIVFSRQIDNANLSLGQDNSAVDSNMAREFTLPRTETAAISGYAVPQPGSRLNDLLNEVPTPVYGLKIAASSSLGSLPRFRPQNLVDGSLSPWIAGTNDASPTLHLTWKSPQSVHSVSLVLSPLASRPTEVSISGGTGAPVVRQVPSKGGTLNFPRVVTSSLRIRILHVVHRATVSPDTGVQLTLPVGLASIAVPGLVTAPDQRPILDTAIHLACGQGPTLVIDGKSVATSVSANFGDLVDLKPVRFAACPPSGTMTLSSGTNHFQALDSSSAFAVSSVAMVDPVRELATSTHDPRTARIDQWQDDSRSIGVSAGSATYLVLAQNFSSGWVAKMGNTTLKPIRVDGWEQGYVVPAGKAATVTLVMKSDPAFRLLLLLGGVFLVLLLLLAVVSSRKTMDDEGGPRASPAVWLLLAGSVVILFVVAGPFALLMAPLLYIGRRWGSRALSVLAFASFAAAGAIAAWTPAHLQTGIASAGAFGGPAQIASVVALGAVLSAFVLEGSRRKHRAGVRFAASHRSVSGDAPIEDQDASGTMRGSG
jgi:arabinofuranan 3-O-arabinosyltransferase